ncbi:MAG: peptidyl-prolyl cis-trans isomerase [Calditrichia bacterium]|nr:peptidyl-prolyl cis-trans isomerase [Calditrichia bacterium]
MGKLLTYSIQLSLILLFLSCQPKNDNSENVIAQVNDAYITLEELEAKIADGTNEEIKLALMRQFMEQWVEEEIFYQTAQNENLDYTVNELRLIKDYKRRLLIQSFIESKINKNYRILEKEIEDYYRQHKEEFLWNEDNIHLIHLVIEHREKKVFAEISKSKDLLEIIKSYYFDMQSTPSRPVGDLGYIKLSDLPEPLVKKVKELSTGTISKPIKLTDGYHFIQLLDFQKKGNYKNLELVRDEIKLRLSIVKRKQELSKLKRELQANFDIQTDISKLLHY